MKHPQIKGKKFEREIAKRLSNYFGLKYKDQLRRTPMSGAIHSFMGQDIICMKKDHILSKLFIECKNRESLNHHKVYWRTREISNVGMIPCLIHRKNNDREAIVTIGFHDFCMLLMIIQEHNLTGLV